MTVDNEVGQPVTPAARQAEWWRDAVVYQIYVRSFADADGDGRGDLPGITGHLDHLASLGVEAIWLTPCYPSPQRDHGYDVADYFDIEPTYGTLDDFDELVATAREHGIKVLMDVVPNHCSSEHAWFREAVAAGRDSRARERFWFRDGRGASGDEPPNNWRCIFGGPAWTRVTEPDGSPGQWYLHTFTPWQPDLNWYDDEVADRFDEMLRFWFDRGVEGFRVDAVPVLGKHPDLPDVPTPPPGLTDAQAWGLNEYANFYPTGHDVWKRWRRVIDQYERDHPGRVLVTISESYGPPEEVRKYMAGDEFHQSFAFDLMLTTWSGPGLRGAIHDALEMLAAVAATPAWTLNNHDTQRIVTRLGRTNAHDPAAHTGNNLVYTEAPIDLALGTRRARAAISLAAALPGALYIYYGEELGLPEVLDLPDEAREDPLFLRTNGEVIGRDGCRVPMPWIADAATNFGFSPRPAAAWLPQPVSYGPLSVASADADPKSILHLYRDVLRARATIDGELRWIELGGDIVGFDRGGTLVLLNPTPDPVTIDAEIVGSRQITLASAAGAVKTPDSMVLPADCCIWLS